MAENIDSIRAEILELETRARELSACLKAMSLVGSSLDLEEVVDLSIETAKDVMNAEAASVLLYDSRSEELYFRQASGEKKDEVKHLRIPKGHGIAGWVMENGEAALVEDVEKDPRFFNKLDKKTGFRTRSIIAAPLKVKDEIIGVAEVMNKKTGPFGKNDLILFEAVASLVAVAVENARLHAELVAQRAVTRELEIARQLQAGMQGPGLATIGKVHFAAISEPARAVGGDLYDWLELGGGRGAIAIGDISGKGIPAALLMANTLSRLRAEALHHDDPARLLASLNLALRTATQGGLFVTLFYGIIDQDGNFRYATAGHPPPLRFRDGDPEWERIPDVPGLPLAVLTEGNYETGEIKLERGDRLLFYTDGVSESRNTKGEELGIDALKEAVRAMVRWERPERTLSRFRAAVVRHQAEIRNDDLTLCVLGYRVDGPEILLVHKSLEPRDLKGVRKRLREFLARTGLPEEDARKVVLALDEALTNVLRHAYRGEPGPVELRGWAEGDRLVFRLLDEGCGEIPRWPPNGGAEIRPGGKGMTIIREVMSDVSFERREKGGCRVTLVKHFETTEEPGG